MTEITREVYNLGNPWLSSWEYNYQKRVKPASPKEIDVVVVGGGITGTYLARRLSTQYPLLKILLIEKSNRIGGKLFSSYLGPDSNPHNTALEYGGMRIFSSIQPRITKLVEFLNLTRVEVPYSAPNNIFSGRTRAFLNSDLFPNTNDVYFVDDGEKDVSVFSTVNDNIYAKFDEYDVDPNPLYEPRVIAFKNPGLSGLCFHNEIVDGQTHISTENYRRYSNITGYTSFFYGSGNFAGLSYENISLNDFDTTQYFVQGGYQQVPVKCIDTFSDITFDNFKNTKYVATNSILMDTELLKFIPTIDNKVQMTVSDGSASITFKTKKLFITTPVDTLQSI